MYGENIEKHYADNTEFKLKEQYITYIDEWNREKWRIERHEFYERKENSKQVICLEKKGTLLSPMHYFTIEMPIGKTKKEKEEIYQMIENNISAIVGFFDK